MKLLEKPKLVEGSNGRPVTARDFERQQWSMKVTCGELAPGCGAVLEVRVPDIFKIVQENPIQRQVGFRCKCSWCHKDVVLPFKEMPVHEGDVPERPAFLRKQMKDLISALHQECDNTDRSRLFLALEKDGISEKYLNRHIW